MNNTNQFAIEDGSFERNVSTAATLVSKFEFFTQLQPGQRVFVPDTQTASGKRSPLPVKAANKELAPAVFKVRDENRSVTNDETGETSTVAGRCIYRIA